MDYGVLLAVLGTCVVSALGLFLWWLRKNDDYWKKRGVPYHPRQDLITALYTFFSKPMHETITEHQNKYGRIYGTFESRSPQLTVSDPDVLKDILVKDFNVFYNRRIAKFGDDVIESMVTALTGEDWKRVRTIISPAFTSRRMRQISHIVNECSATVLETLGKHHERKEPVDFKSIFGAFTMDVIASAAFATKLDSHNDPENVFVKHVKKAFFTPSLWQIFVFFFMPTWITVTFQLGRNKSIDFFKDVILQVVEERKNSGKKFDDLLQLLMDSQEELETEKPKSDKMVEDESDRFGSVMSVESETPMKYKKLSENELLAQCVLFFIVGYETTASILSFMAYELALNPDCQGKLLSEVDEAFEKHKKFDHDVVREMKYLDCVVSETLRKYPSLVRSERTASEDYKLRNTDIVIEKGHIVAFNIYCIHHDPEYFPDPEKFQPERFFPENVTHPQYAYLPFGAGPRNCLGMRFALMEIKICMCNILKNYRLTKAETTKVPLEFKMALGFISVEKLPLMIEKRRQD